MRLAVFITGLFAAAILFVANGQPAHAQAQPEQNTSNQPAVVQPVIEEVQKGDSLSKIANRHQTTYSRLFDANLEIADPNVIYPGQKVRIPDASEQLASRTVQPAVAAPAPQAKAAKPAQPKKAKAKVAKPQTAPANAVGGSVWDQLAKCESGGNWAINTGNGYYGGLQFTAATWKAVGGSGLPHQASREEQIMRGQILQARSGWGQWPACTKKLGLR